MTPAELKRVLRLESALAQCQNALTAARAKIAQLEQTAKAKARKAEKAKG